jgi:hypothetical protein
VTARPVPGAGERDRVTAAGASGDGVTTATRLAGRRHREEARARRLTVPGGLRTTISCAGAACLSWRLPCASAWSPGRASGTRASDGG